MNKNAQETKKKKPYTVLVAVLALLVVAALAVTALLLAFGEDAAVMECDGTVITEPMYAYLLSACKYDFLVSYKNYGLKDTRASWESPLPGDVGEGQTWASFFEESFRTHLERMLVGAMLYDRELSLSAADKEALDGAIDDYASSLGGENEANGLLKEYGCTLSDVRRVLALEKKAELYFKEVYGADGEKVSAEKLEAEYQKNFARVKTIFVRTSGAMVGSDSEGDPVYATMTEAELNAANEKIAKIGFLLAGTASVTEDAFVQLQKEYTEDGAAKDFPGGYYLSEGCVYDPKVIDKALAMEIGTWDKVDGEYGTFFIYRCANVKGAYATTENRQWFEGFALSVAADLYGEELALHMDKVAADEEALSAYSVIYAKQSYEIQIG